MEINNIIENKNKTNIDFNHKQNNNINDTNNIVPTKNMNNTLTNFPKIKQDLSEKKYTTIIHRNNDFETKDMNIVAKTLSVAKIKNQEVKVASNIKKQKKILLINPDDIPPNSIMGKKIRNNIANPLGNQIEKVNKSKKLENIYNHKSLPFPNNSYGEGIYKSPKNKENNY